MKNFWSKWTISASSGLFGKVVLVVAVSIGAGYAGTKIIGMPEDSPVAQAIARLIPFYIPFVTSVFFMNLSLILNWLSERRESKIKESESKNEELRLQNEGLKLQKEILELEIQRENQQSYPDNQK